MRLASPRITPLNTLGVQLDAGLEGFARWRR
jgi:hypothetical protein